MKIWGFNKGYGFHENWILGWSRRVYKFCHRQARIIQACKDDVQNPWRSLAFSISYKKSLWQIPKLASKCYATKTKLGTGGSSKNCRINKNNLSALSAQFHPFKRHVIKIQLKMLTSAGVFKEMRNAARFLVVLKWFKIDSTAKGEKVSN